MLENIQSPGVRGHHAVFDAVVHHLDEVAGAGRAAVEIAFFGGRGGSFVASGGGVDGAASGGQSLEGGIEIFPGFASPPIIRQYPRSRPKTPPLVPTSTHLIPASETDLAWRRSST